jgi:hypothetical protein
VAAHLGLEELAGGETHGLSEVLQCLADLNTLLLHQVILDILELHQHLLGVHLALLQLGVPVLLDSLQMGKQGYFLVLLQHFLPLLYSVGNLLHLGLLLLLL